MDREAIFNGPGEEEGALRFYFVDEPNHWVDVNFSPNGVSLSPGQTVMMRIPPCKHHGEILCRCPAVSRSGNGIEVFYDRV